VSAPELTPREIRIIENFDRWPNGMVVSAKIAAIILDLSERTIRRHPMLPRAYTSADRYGFRIGSIRTVAHEGVPPADRRVRVGPAATRLVQEVAGAANRDEGRRLLAGYDLSKFSDDERERLNELLEDKISELPGSD
jgi:hypothetical protein